MTNALEYATVIEKKANTEQKEPENIGRSHRGVHRGPISSDEAAIQGAASSVLSD